jgi:hypothetical protein
MADRGLALQNTETEPTVTSQRDKRESRDRDLEGKRLSEAAERAVIS